MSSPLKPRDDYVVAQKEKAQPKTKGGIYLPESAQEKPETFVVLDVGRNVKSVKAGDKIVYVDQYESVTKIVPIDGEEYKLIREDTIIATVK